MNYYPIFLRVENSKCLLAGAGKVGVRKLKALLRCNPSQVLVLETGKPSKELEEILDDPRITFEQRQFSPEDLNDKFLIFACTDNKQINKKIADLCCKNKILCNIADLPEESDFVVPSIVRQGELTLAVSTGGNSPALTKKIRKELQSVFGCHYAMFLTLMGKLRPLILGLNMGTNHNSALFRELVGSPLLDELEAGNSKEVKKLLAEILPNELVPHILELTDDLI